MSAAVDKAADSLAVLESTIQTTLSLIATFQTSIVPQPPAPATEDTSETKDQDPKSKSKSKNHDAINALDLAHDVAKLIKAHSTKISLLIINKPFTPTAINTVLRELVAGPLPGLASAVELCDGAAYTKVMSAELQWRAKRVFAELATLLKAIPLDGKILTEDQKNGTGNTAGKGSLVSTGVVWEACDSVVELKITGVAGLLIQKAELYRDLVKDALEELQEWAAEGSDDEDEPDLEAAYENEVGNEAQDAVDNLFGSQKHIPKDDPDKIRERLDSTTKRLRLMALMYQAVIKRRFRTLPALPHPELPIKIKEKSSEDPGIVECLDTLLDRLKKIPDDIDELANAFYELDGEQIDQKMDQCFFLGFAAVELLLKNWEGEKDEFTTWVSPASVLLARMPY